MEINYDYSKFDFNKPITREQIDLEIYNNKFAYVDLYKSLKAPSKDMLATIWNDVTMFAYMFLRLDGRALKLYPYQDIILNDPYRFKYFESANQVGKSISLDVQAVFNFTHDNGLGFNTAIVVNLFRKQHTRCGGLNHCLIQQSSVGKIIKVKLTI